MIILSLICVGGARATGAGTGHERSRARGCVLAAICQVKLAEGFYGLRKRLGGGRVMKFNALPAI